MRTLVIRYGLGSDRQSPHGISLISIVGTVESIILGIHFRPLKVRPIVLFLHIYFHLIVCIGGMLCCCRRSDIISCFIAGEQISGLYCCRICPHLIRFKDKVIEIRLTIFTGFSSNSPPFAVTVLALLNVNGTFPGFAVCILSVYG